MASFGVSATVQATCLVSAPSVTFAIHTGAMLNATSTVSVNCTNSTPYSISLSAGSPNGAAVATRRTTETDSALLIYALAPNSQEVVTQGRMVDTDTAGGTGVQEVVTQGRMVDTDTAGGTGNGSAQVLADLGKFSAERHVTAGAYADTIAVTVIF